MKQYLFLNKITGKKFKTTMTGKAQVQKHPKLSKSCMLLGECDEKGRLLSDTIPLANKTVESLKEIMTKPTLTTPVPVVEEVKFSEPVEPIKEKRKYNVKEKANK